MKHLHQFTIETEREISAAGAKKENTEIDAIYEPERSTLIENRDSSQAGNMQMKPTHEGGMKRAVHGSETKDNRNEEVESRIEEKTCRWMDMR